MSRFAIIGAIGSMAAACSTDAMRLSGTPFANPFGSEQPEPTATASVERPVRPAPMPRSTVQSAPLAPPAQQVASAPAYNRPPAVEATNPAARVAGMNPAATAPTPSRPSAPARVAEAAPTPAARPAQGRLVSREQIAAARPAAPVAEHPRARPGQLAWQRGPEPTKAEVKAQSAAQKVAAAPVKAAPAKESVKVAAKPAEPAKPANAEVAKASKPEPVKVAKAEPAKPVPGVASQPKAAEPAKVVAAAKPSAPQKLASVEPAKPVSAAEPARPSREPESTASLPAQPAAANADFRWPARGRVISGFGGSGGNEGINIAVPDGTPVKAAESGTVAYAGNEVKGYGNLVLIRHDNGYVSAYAHNGEVEVKRGQRVSRGQTIAKSGQSGNVTSPQLHFEIRKGSQPVDPMKYLASN